MSAHPETKAQIYVIGSENTALYVKIMPYLSSHVSVTFVGEKLEFTNTYYGKGQTITGMDSIKAFVKSFVIQPRQHEMLTRPNAHDIKERLRNEKDTFDCLITFVVFLVLLFVINIVAIRFR